MQQFAPSHRVKVMSAQAPLLSDTNSVLVCVLIEHMPVVIKKIRCRMSLFRLLSVPFLACIAKQRVPDYQPKRCANFYLRNGGAAHCADSVSTPVQSAPPYLIRND